MVQHIQSRSNKIVLFLLIVAAIFWLGGINIRALVGNELLIYDQFKFRTSIPPDRENTLFQIIANSSIVIMSGYFVVLVTAVWFLSTTKLKMKENGWLLMSSVLFFIFVPAEVYTYFLDFKFIFLYYSNPPNHDQLLELFGERLGGLSGIPVIALLSYYTIIGLVIFKPLKKVKDDKEKEAG